MFLLLAGMGKTFTMRAGYHDFEHANDLDYPLVCELQYVLA